jgi:heme-degrading monooxygenase HmoA
MIIQTIKFKSQLTEEEVMRIAREREPQFKAIPGLIQKYYIKPQQDDHYGGVYIWDSAASLNAYRASDLAASIPKAYGIIGAPDVEIVDVIFQLRK